MWRDLAEIISRHGIVDRIRQTRESAVSYINVSIKVRRADLPPLLEPIVMRVMWFVEQLQPAAARGCDFVVRTPLV